MEKKKEKRKLGILELAIKEFEDESEVRQNRFIMNKNGLSGGCFSIKESLNCIR